MPEARMNGNGQYLVLPPKAKKETGYTRTSNVAKLLEDGNSLINWRVRQTMQGLVKRPDLVKMVQAHPGDKAALDRIAGDALEAAESSAGANSGTALHSVLHQWGEGRPVNLLEGSELRKDMEAVEAYFTANNLFPLQGWCEHMVVHHKVKVAGTFDLLLDLADTPDDSNDIVLADYKTTKEDSIGYAFGAWAIQLAIYSHGVAYVQDPKPGFEREVPWPDRFNPERGLIVHAPAGAAMCTIYEVDLKAGWEAAKHAFFAREWRKRKDLVRNWPDRTAALLEASVEQALASKAVNPVEHPVVPEAAEATEMVEQPVPSMSLFMPDKTIAAAVMALHAPVAAVAAPEPPLALQTPVAADEPFVTQHEATQAVTARLKAQGATTSLFGAPVGAVQQLVDIPPSRPLAPAPTSAPPPVLEAPTAATAEPPPPQGVPASVPKQDLFNPSNAVITPTMVTAIQDAFPGTVVEKLSDHEARIKEELRQQQRSQVKSRLEYIKVHFPHLLEKLSFEWPTINGEAVPGLAGNHLHTTEELDAIEIVLLRAEGEVGLPFPDELPGRIPPPAPVVLPPPQSDATKRVMAEHQAIWDKVAAVDNGPGVSPDLIEALANRLRDLPPAAIEMFSVIGTEAESVGWKMNVHATRAQRQWEIARALIFAAEAGLDVANVVDVKTIARRLYDHDIPHCDIIGGLTIQQAQTLAKQFEDLRYGKLVLAFDDAGAKLEEVF